MKTLKVIIPLGLAMTFVATSCGLGGGSATVSDDASTDSSVAPVVITEPPVVQTTITTVAPTTTTMRETPPPPPTPTWQTVYTLTAKKRTADAAGRIPPFTVPIYQSRGGSIMSIQDTDGRQDPTFWGSTLVFLVTEGRPGDEWAEVLISSRPNNTRGWVRTEDFQWKSTDYHITVDLSDDTVSVWKGNDLVSHSLAITGKPSRPTPVAGLTYVEAKLPNLADRYGTAYGTWVLPLALFSETLESFAGGLPQVAIHGTNVPELLGQEESSGCIRIHNDIINMLAETIPVGTPVRIVI